MTAPGYPGTAQRYPAAGRSMLATAIWTTCVPTLRATKVPRPGTRCWGRTDPTNAPSSGLPDRTSQVRRSPSGLDDRVVERPSRPAAAPGEDQVQPDIAGLPEQRHQGCQRGAGPASYGS